MSQNYYLLDHFRLISDFSVMARGENRNLENWREINVSCVFDVYWELPSNMMQFETLHDFTEYLKLFA